MATIPDLLATFGPRLRRAFLAAVQEIADQAQIGQITRALERGDIQGAVDALYLDRAAYRTFEAEIAAAYGGGGAATIENLPAIREPDGGRFIIRFDVRNFRAEQWLLEHSSSLVTRTVADQRQALREALRSGMERGDNPRTVALDVAGRMNRVTGRREGGIVGLSAAQERAVEAARRELQNGEYAAYRSRTRRDKRFDRTIARAEREGRPLTATDIRKITARYSDRLLKLRGDTIARTEALTSLHAAQYEAIQQLVDSGKVTANQVRRVWDATGDTRTRFSHLAADGQSVGLNEPFVMPSGATLRYPGDPNGPAEEIVNCRCAVKIRIDFLANVGR